MPEESPVKSIVEDCRGLYREAEFLDEIWQSQRVNRSPATSRSRD